MSAVAQEHGEDITKPARIWDNEQVRETIVLVVLAVTAVLTAWSGFESSKWSGQMSISFSQASSARVESARQLGIANAARQADLTIWGVFVQATAQEDEQLQTYVEERFTDHFRVAYDEWVAQGMPTNGPFAMPEYVPPGATESAAADDRADEKFIAALEYNQLGDNYTLLTVLFALVLFFASVSGRLREQRSRWVMVGLSVTVFTVGVVLLGTQPILV